MSVRSVSRRARRGGSMSAISARRSQLAVRARATGGRFVLRFDDTDRERSTEEYVEAFARISLARAWMGA